MLFSWRWPRRDPLPCPPGKLQPARHADRIGDLDVAASALRVDEWEQTFPGTPDQIRHVRSALRALLEGCSAADDVVHILSECSANACQHSSSGEPGGTFIVRLHHHSPGECVWGEVEDEGSPWNGDLAASARDQSGLFIVMELASACGVAEGTGHHHDLTPYGPSPSIHQVGIAAVAATWPTPGVRVVLLPAWRARWANWAELITAAPPGSLLK